MPYYVDNEPIRIAVLLAKVSREITFNGLAGELGYRRSHVSTLRRALGLSKVRCAHTLKMVRPQGIKCETGRRIFELCAVDEPEAEFLVPAPSTWGNGKPMFYSWRLRILVEHAIKEGRVTLAGVARELGYVRCDSAPLRRALGLKPHKGKFQTKMDEKTAIWLCHRLGYDPVDWGI